MVWEWIYLPPTVIRLWLNISCPIRAEESTRSLNTSELPALLEPRGIRATSSFEKNHVTADKLVDAGLPRSIARLITDRDGVARQGYATSPAASNLAFQTVDHRILALLAAECPGAVYTRYADDLTISANDREALIRVQRNLEALIASAGFKVSARKTHVLAARAGRRVVTGVAVGETDLRVTRSTRRRLRAAEHADNRMQARGLREWSLLKTPRDKLP